MKNRYYLPLTFTNNEYIVIKIEQALWLGKQMPKKMKKKPDLEDFGLSDSFFKGPVTSAHRLLFAKLQKLITGHYEDPYKGGPQKMAKYFDAFLEFFRQEYPEDKGCKGTLQSLMPKQNEIQLPDKSLITIAYNMETQLAEYKITNPDGQVEKVTNRHIEIAQMFKNSVQEGIFGTITMLVDAMPKDAREEMANKYLDLARSKKTSDRNEK